MDDHKIGDIVRVEFNGKGLFANGQQFTMYVVDLDPLLVGYYYVGGTSFVFGPQAYKSVRPLHQ